MALDLDISRVRSVKGSREQYHLEVEFFDLEDENWTLAKPMVIDAEISHEKQFLQMNGKLSESFEPFNTNITAQCFNSRFCILQIFRYIWFYAKLIPSVIKWS